MEDQSKLFKMFGKLESTSKINTNGIGLGLVICKQIVLQNHGELEVVSPGLNKGSTFMFSMRMDQATPEQISEMQQMQDTNETRYTI